MMKIDDCGLLAADPEAEPGAQPFAVPLTGVRVRARIKGPFGRVTVEQDYENSEPVPVEAAYVFPLPEGGAVSDFCVTIDGHRIRGEVLERDEAFDRYDDAMAEGHGAFLLDQERPNIFTASVGNLLPGQKATVEISYLVELPAEGDGARLMIPTTVSPRYVPKSRRTFPGMTDADRVSPPVSPDGVPYRLELVVEADLLSPVRAVESPSHRIRTEIRGETARVSFAGDEGALDRDFVLHLEPAEPFRPVARQAADEGGDRFVLASFRPEIRAPRGPVEVAFVVDCSGSMHGTSIEQARRTLLLSLQSLEPGDRFNVVRFGSAFQKLFDRSLPYDDESLEKGRRLAGSMQADLGGTEILTPLEEVLGSPGDEELPLRVVLLTDGQVSNEDQVIALARKRRKRATIFAFGIGAGSSEYLVRGVARASGGSAEFVFPGETVEGKVLRHFGRIAAADSDLSVEFRGLKVVDRTPESFPAVTAGDRVDVIARVKAGTEGDAVLRGRVGTEEIEIVVPIVEGPRDAEADGLLPLLWARRRIRELEEGSGDPGRGSRQRDRKRDRTNAEIVRLATRYGLMSSATSYVAVEERAEGERTGKRAKLRKIPVALTSGWGGLDGLVGPPPPSPARFVGRRADTERFLACCAPSAADTLDDLAVFEEADFGPAAGAVEALSCPTEAAPQDRLTRILFSQNADGSWSFTDGVRHGCGVDRALLDRAVREIGGSDAERILATLIVLALAEQHPEEEREFFRHMLRKARRWLETQLGGRTPPSPHSSWEAWAATLV